MSGIRNQHVYRRDDGMHLTYISTCLARTPEEAVAMAADHPGKFVAIDSTFTGNVTKVNVTLSSSAEIT